MSIFNLTKTDESNVKELTTRALKVLMSASRFKDKYATTFKFLVNIRKNCLMRRI